MRAARHWGRLISEADRVYDLAHESNAGRSVKETELEKVTAASDYTPAGTEVRSPRLDAVLEFVKLSARSMPLVDLLDEAPRGISRALRADICSLYVLEDEHTLVMRGNVGFKKGALGDVRLVVGEGITGQAVQSGQAIRVHEAKTHAAYKHVSGLGEEAFPIFLVAPIFGRSGPVGAITVQRAKRPFSDADAELLVAFGASIAAGIKYAALDDETREKKHASRRAGGGTRRVTLPGRPIVPGRALGAIAALRRPSQRPSERIQVKGDDAAQEKRILRSALDVAEKSIDALRKRASKLEIARDASFLDTYGVILDDMRFRERVFELIDGGAPLATALSQVAREVTRAAASLTKDAFLDERAQDIEDLCDALTMLAATDKRAEIPSKSVIIGDNLSVFDLLISARAQPVAVVLSERAKSKRSRTLLELLASPSIIEVRGLFAWANDGDIALVDADHGLVTLNPSKREIAHVREFRRHSEAPGKSEPPNDGGSSASS